MPKLIALVGFVAGLLLAPEAWLGNAGPAELAATMLLDNRALCHELARAATSSAADGSAARKALARENLAIAAELVRSIGNGREEVRLLERALRLERRLCGDPPARGEPMALAIEGEVVLQQLELLAAADSNRRQRILNRFLERQERAILAASRRETGRKSSEVLTSTAEHPESPQRGTDERRPLASSGLVRPAEPREPDAVANEVSQQFEPSLEELERRRRLEEAVIRRRLARWGLSFRREVRHLVTLRVRMAEELELRSLEQLEILCVRLGEAAAGFDDRVVSALPDRGLRIELERMLSRYETAGHSCADGRFSRAWTEIAEADRRLGTLGVRLLTLEAGADRTARVPGGD